MNFTLNTDRLILKQPVINNVGELFELMQDKRLTQFLTWEAHTEIKTTEILVKNLIDAQTIDKAYHWCIYFEKKIIGLASLIDVKRQIRTWTINRAELSYWIGTDFQSKGFATEASKAIVEFGFNKLKLHKIIIAHAEENVESKRICEKLGFKHYALEHDAFCKNNQWHDLIWYEIIKKENI